MATTVITFLNGETIELNETSILNFVGHYNDVESDSPYVSESIQYSGPVSMSNYHVELGLAPELVDHLHNSDYFFLHHHPDILYSAKSIFKIESSLD